jgi:hypothetical protein
MKKLTVPLLALSLVAISFALGWYAGSHANARDSLQASRAGDSVEAIDETDASVADLLRDPNLLRRVAGLSRILQGLGPENVASVAGAYEQLMADRGGGVHSIDARLLAQAWASFDPEGALQRLSGWSRYHRENVLPELIIAWASRDPLAAKRALESGDTGLAVEGLMDSLVRGWALADEPGLDEFVAATPPGGTLQRRTMMLVRARHNREGSQAVIRWAESLPDDPDSRFKPEAFRKAATVVTRDDPLLAAAWVEEHRGRDYADGMMRRVAMQWGRQDGEALFEWLRDQPPGEERDSAMRSGYEKWLTADREGAMAWMRRLELHPSLEPALDVFARALARTSPEEAVDWAGRIADPKRREGCLVAIGQAWHRSDSEAAWSWLARSELSDEARRAVVEGPRGARRRTARGRGTGPIQIEAPPRKLELH